MKHPINAVIKFKKYDGELGIATICGYDICKTKYQAWKHSFDSVPMKNFVIWLFENEVFEIVT